MRCRPRDVNLQLPDDVLLAIFDFCVIEGSTTKKEIEGWQSLVQVCRQWRTVVFGSPRRLNLRLFCATKTQTPVRDTLDIWPALPLVIRGGVDDVDETEELDNIIAVLERSDRVCYINLSNLSHSGHNAAAMQKSFPELTHLRLHSNNVTTIVPDSFLGGSAPRLQLLRLDGIPFPGLPKLLLSATHLVTLHLRNIPHSGYIAPEVIVTALSTLTSLETLGLGFWSRESFPDGESPRPPPPPLTRSVLPVLSKLDFEGTNNYLEDLVARIDTPQLSSLRITLFSPDIFDDTPQIIQFISRTPNLKAFKEARLTFMNVARLTLSSSNGSGYGVLDVKILRRSSNWQVYLMGQVCTSCLPPLSSLEDLYIYEDPRLPQNWKDNVSSTNWLELLHSFSAVRSLYLCEEFALRIAPVLHDLVGGRTTEVLPALRNIFLEGLQPSGPVQERIAKFVAARQLSGHSIAISLWERGGASLGLGTTTYS